MQLKNMMVDIKSAPGEAEAGSFVGYASVFGNKDSYGDVVMSGAFTKSLAGFGERGSNIPCYWGHQMDDPMKCIGWTTQAIEDEKGLRVHVKLDLDNPNGAQAHKLIKAGVVNQMSFAFEVEDYAFTESKAMGQYCELRQLKIFEVSLVQVGANQDTELLDVKDRLVGVKKGRSISSDNESKLTQAASLINEVLKSTSSDDSNDESDDSEDTSDTGGSSGDDDDKKTSSSKSGDPENSSRTTEDSSDQESAERTSEDPETDNGKDAPWAKSRTLSDIDLAELELTLIEEGEL